MQNLIERIARLNEKNSKREELIINSQTAKLLSTLLEDKNSNDRKAIANLALTYNSKGE